MATKIRKCRYVKCLHDTKDIDLLTDEYVQVGRSYYHKDCKEDLDNHVCCHYANCRHKDKDIDLRTDEYVKEGLDYWHPDCKKESDTIRQIIDFWHKNIRWEASTFGNLQRVIKKLIEERGYDAEYILFALIEKVGYLHYPPGLFYATDDYKLKEKYARLKAAKKRDEEIKAQKPVIKEEKIYNLEEAIRRSNFSDIFGGI